MMFSTPILVAIATFGTHMALGYTLTAAVAFPTIALFATLRVPLSFIPMVISNTVKMNIAKSRVTDFLYVILWVRLICWCRVLIS